MYLNIESFPCVRLLNLSGEVGCSTWGYLGSRKFLQELDKGADSVNGINSLMMDQNSSASKKILDALQSASKSLGSDNVEVKQAASSNPGVPPSSLMSFVRKQTSILHR
nr:unnamed protein product [Digitaria exilis]